MAGEASTEPAAVPAVGAAEPRAGAGRFTGLEQHVSPWSLRNRSSLLCLVVALLSLGACVPPGSAAGGAPGGGSGTSVATVGNPGYEQALSHWLDRPEEDLIAAWGVPERSQALTDGGQVLEYRRVDATGRLLCSTLFTSDVYGKIRVWTYRGIDCRAPQLGDYGAHP